MDDGKRMLLDWIAENEEVLVEFPSAFVQAKHARRSPNRLYFPYFVPKFVGILQGQA